MAGSAGSAESQDVPESPPTRPTGWHRVAVVPAWLGAALLAGLTFTFLLDASNGAYSDDFGGLALALQTLIAFTVAGLVLGLKGALGRPERVRPSLKNAGIVTLVAGILMLPMAIL